MSARSPAPTLPHRVLRGLARLGVDLRPRLHRYREFLVAPAKRELETKLAELELQLEALQRSSAAMKRDEARANCALRQDLQLIETLVLAGLEGLPTSARQDGPLVSIVLPTYDRGATIGDAIRSVQAQSYRNWELLVLDDGGNDETPFVVQAYLDDSRIRFQRQSHRGVSAARNAALASATGELIAYIDSDNVWLPGFLAGMVAFFAARPQLQSAYGMLVRDVAPAGETRTLWKTFDAQALKSANYIDLNVFVHRRALYERFGGFDEDLQRFIDWDLILRYTADDPAIPVPVPGAHYRVIADRRITTDVPFGFAWYGIQRKLRKLPTLPGKIRVLYALFHYPQASETYIEVEIRAMRRLGVDVEVWSANYVATPYPSDIRIYTGGFAEAIAASRPDVVHIHWLTFALQNAAEIAASGLPVTVRAHGFETTRDTIAQLLALRFTRRVHIYPHQAEKRDFAEPRISIIRSGFETSLFQPVSEKDRRLVVRTSAALESKQLELFLELALRLPEFRFVLAIIACSFKEKVVDDLIALRDRLGSPAEILVNLPHEDSARLIASAGLYLHTFAAPGEPNGAPAGQPISIAEAMATGCHVLVRDLPPLRAYIGEAGAVYCDIDDAERQIAATRTWSDAQWREAAHRAVDRAWMWHTDDFALRPVLESWVDIMEFAACDEPIEAPSGADGWTPPVA